MSGASRTAPRATVACPFCAEKNRVDLTRLGDGPKCGSCSKPLHLDRPVGADDESLMEVVGGTEVPVLVDFYADWCAPCRLLAPMLDQLAADRAGEAVVAKVDTDRSPAMAIRYQIRGIPTLVAFRGGREVARHVGVASRERMEEMLREAAEA